MAPKKKERLSCGRSRTRSHNITYPKKSPKNNFAHREYSETILHRLRPRVRRLYRESDTVRKVCASEARRKRNRRPVKRCFIQYRKKRRYRGNRNRGPRVNPSRKSAGDFRSKNTVVRPIQPSETSAVAKNYRRQISFIRSIKDYIFSTFREGTKWAKNYICQAFRSDNKFTENSEVPRIKERNAISPSYSHVILQPGQSDYKDRTRRRYKTRNNQQQDDDGVMKFNGNAATSKGSLGSPKNVQRIDVSGENPGNYLVALSGKHRHSDVITNHTAMCSRANDKIGNFVNKDGQARSQRRRKRRKTRRTNKRIVRNVVRYNQTAEIISERHPFVRSNGSAVINFLKTYSDTHIESGNEFVDRWENNFYENKKEMVMNELDDRGVIPFDETVASEREEVMRYGKKKDKFSKPSTENDNLEKIIENK